MDFSRDLLHQQNRKGPLRGPIPSKMFAVGLTFAGMRLTCCYGACLTEDGGILPLSAVCDLDVRDEGHKFFVECSSFAQFARRTRLLNFFQHPDGSWRVSGCFGMRF